MYGVAAGSAWISAVALVPPCRAGVRPGIGWACAWAGTATLRAVLAASAMPMPALPAWVGAVLRERCAAFDIEPPSTCKCIERWHDVRTVSYCSRDACD